MTYNHEKYITKAIESVLMQKTNFDVELVIGDDFSTDNTRTIINKYKNLKKEKICIKILDRPTNGLYHQKRKNFDRKVNFYDIIENCNGDYIALLDGDDYWTDPYKLQKQITFLEENQDYILCFHKVNCLLPTGKLQPFSKVNYEDFTSKQLKLELIKTNFIASCSSVFRNVKIDFSEFSNLHFVDYPLYFFLIKHGKMKCLKDNMGVYRIHKKGIWSNKKHTKRVTSLIHFHESYLKHFIISSDEQYVYARTLKNMKHEIASLYIKDIGIYSFFLKKLSNFIYSLFFLKKTIPNE